MKVLRQIWRGERAGALISAELLGAASSCIVAVSVLIVFTLPSDWSLNSLSFHLLSISPGHIIAQQHKVDCRLLSLFGPQSSLYRRLKFSLSIAAGMVPTQHEDTSCEIASKRGLCFHEAQAPTSFLFLAI